MTGQRGDCLDGLLAEYPGPGGVSTYWYGLDGGAAGGGGRVLVR
ncbi:hypothetical protein [Rhodococcus oxybenzonivorans]|nr:hypothetical protein [Rhodococcus oxybenzonivorans]